MIKTLLTMTVFISLNVFSQAESMGGQNGSGGNGCYITSGNGRSWRSLEEVSLSRPIYRRETVSFGHGYDRNRLHVGRKSQILVKNMSKFGAIKEFRAIINKLSIRTPHLTNTLLELLAFFENVHVIQHKIKGLYDGDPTNTDRECENYAPVFLTKKDGTVIVSAPIWNDMDPTSKEFIVVHEVLRFAQMFHPAFIDFSDLDLQEFTKNIMLEKLRPTPKVMAIEERLEQDGSYYFSSASSTRAESIFSEKMNSCHEQGLKLKTCLTELYQNSEYRKLILGAIKQD